MWGKNMWYILYLNVIVRDPSSEQEKRTGGEKRGAVCGIGVVGIGVVGVGRAVKTGRPRAAGQVGRAAGLGA